MKVITNIICILGTLAAFMVTGVTEAETAVGEPTKTATMVPDKKNQKNEATPKPILHRNKPQKKSVRTAPSASKPSKSAHIKNPQQIKNVPQRFVTTGKVGYSDGKQGGNATFRWEQNGDHYRIKIMGPLSSGSLEVIGQKGTVYLLKSDGGNRKARTAEALLRSELGWTIPVSGLRYWLRGIPDPNSTPQKILFNKGGSLAFLKQHGWTIYYEEYEYDRGIKMPYRITLFNGPLRLKFIFKNWSF